MKVFDRYKRELNVGDDVCFTSNGWLEEGYIYKIIDRKVFMTTAKRGERPRPDAYKVCDSEVLRFRADNVGGDPLVAGHFSLFINRLRKRI